jgi:hypothetical protein
MADLIKEERYTFFDGTKEHVLRLQELLRGSTVWPEKFRIHVHASYRREAKDFFETTAHEAIERAIEYLSSPVARSGHSLFGLRASH